MGWGVVIFLHGEKGSSSLLYDYLISEDQLLSRSSQVTFSTILSALQGKRERPRLRKEKIEGQEKLHFTRL